MTLVALFVLVCAWSAAAQTGEPSVVALRLYDAERDAPIRDLAASDVIDLGRLGAQGIETITVVAITEPEEIGSVRFDLDGREFALENLRPYAIRGDNAGTDLRPWNIGPGTYTLTAVPYRESGAEGAAGAPLEVVFEVVAAPASPEDADGAPDEAAASAPADEAADEAPAGDAASDVPPSDAADPADGAEDSGAGSADADIEAANAAEGVEGDSAAESSGEPAEAAAEAAESREDPANDPLGAAQSAPVDDGAEQRFRYSLLPFGEDAPSGDATIAAFGSSRVAVTVRLETDTPSAFEARVKRSGCGAEGDVIATLPEFDPNSGVASVSIGVALSEIRSGFNVVLVTERETGRALACAPLLR